MDDFSEATRLLKIYKEFTVTERHYDGLCNVRIGMINFLFTEKELLKLAKEL